MRPKTTKTTRARPTTLPGDDDAFVRWPDLQAIFPVSKTSWYDGIRSGRYPRAVRLGPRTVAWRVRDIRKLLESFTDDAA